MSLINFEQANSTIAMARQSADTAVVHNNKGQKTALDFLRTDLTAQAKAGKLDPVIGRDAQIRRLYYDFEPPDEE